MEHAPHTEEVFSGFRIVGILKENYPTKSYWIKWYGKYHPHPMLVHFPIALHLFSGGLDLLFFFQPEASYATAVYYTFFTATVTGGLAMIPGILSWWLNYDLAFTSIFVIKLLFSIITLFLGVIAIIIYLNDPDIVYLMNIPSIIYHGIVLLTTLTVVVVTYYGGKLTWSNKESS